MSSWTFIAFGVVSAATLALAVMALLLDKQR